MIDLMFKIFSGYRDDDKNQNHFKSTNLCLNKTSFLSNKMSSHLLKLDEEFESHNKHLKLQKNTVKLKTLDDNFVGKLTWNIVELIDWKMVDSGGYVEFQKENFITKRVNRFYTKIWSDAVHEILNVYL